MVLSVAAAPKKRNRLTRAGYESLDRALFDIAEEQHPMSVRGLYYQAEVRELVGKEEKYYGLVQRRCLKLRRDDVMPYPWITDNSRSVYNFDRYDGVDEFQSSIAHLYRRNYWSQEPFRVEIWLEKDALMGVINATVTNKWGVDLYVQKGFSSASYLFAAAEAIKNHGKPTHIYVLSDFDPSGKCSLDKIEPGIKRHLGKEIPIWVHDLGVTPAQIKKWNLPTRTTKVKGNSHYPAFKRKYGDLAERSCELDAIRPDFLRDMVSEAIERHWSNKRTLQHLKMIEQEERELFKNLNL